MGYDNRKRLAWADAGYSSKLGSAAASLPPAAKFIRLYYLTSALHALSNIAFGRLKVARFRDMNDPFELLSLRLADKGLRKAAYAFKDLEQDQTGLVCLSADWRSPVMWSHYADRHRGICLGLDVLRESVEQVQYNDERVRAELDEDHDLSSLPPELQRVAIRTKCREWQYEQEYRIRVPLGSAKLVGGLHFKLFDPDFRLAEVILGPNCTELLDDVRKVVSCHQPTATTFCARLAWKFFQVVPKESTVP